MQAVNINSLANGIKNSAESSRKKESSINEKGFKAIFKSTKEYMAATENIKVLKNSEGNEINKLEDSNTSVNLGSGDEAVEKTVGEPDIAVKDKKEFTELLEMLILMGGNLNTPIELQKAIQSDDLDSIKKITLELFENGMNLSEAKQDFHIAGNELNNTALITEFNKFNESSRNIKEMVEFLSSNLISNEAQKADVVSMLKDFKPEGTEFSSDELRNSIINRLMEFVNKKDNNSVISNESKNSVLENNIFSNESGKENLTEYNQGAFETETNTENYLQSGKTVEKVDLKEDKLLKDVLGEKKSGSKDALNDKIASVVTRFGNIKLDKAPEVAAKPVITKSNFDMDFVKTVKFMDMNNLKELSVKIIPRDLGEIVIRLTMDNGVMKANITAQNKETYNLLNSQLPTISNQLTEQNMAIQSFSLSLGNGESFMSNSGGNQGNENGQGNRQTSKAVGLEEESITEGYNFEENTVNTLA